MIIPMWVNSYWLCTLSIRNCYRYVVEFTNENQNNNFRKTYVYCIKWGLPCYWFISTLCLKRWGNSKNKNQWSWSQIVGSLSLFSTTDLPTYTPSLPCLIQNIKFHSERMLNVQHCWHTLWSSGAAKAPSLLRTNKIPAPVRLNVLQFN